MRFLNTLALTLATGATIANARLFYGSVRDGEVMVPGDIVRSGNGHTNFDIMPDGRPRLSYMSIETTVFNTPGVISIKPVAGQLVMVHSAGTRTFGHVAVCNGNGLNTWYFNVWDGMELNVESACGVTWKSKLTWADYKPWAMELSIPMSYDAFTSDVNKTMGAGTVLYYLDTGIQKVHDPALTMWNYDTGATSWTDLGSFGSASSPPGVQYAAHGTHMAMVAKNKLVGLAQVADIASAKITDGDGLTFSEQAAIKAIQAVVNHNAGTKQKIINFSGYFGASQPNAFSCAQQIAYTNNIAFFAAAGNANIDRPRQHAYQFVVASATDNLEWWTTSKLWPKTNFGGNDIYGPLNFVQWKRNGTSYSTAYVSAIASAAVSYHPSTLSGSPARIYKYLSDSARTDKLPASDPKILANPVAGTKIAYIGNFATVTPSTNGHFNASHFIDYCGPLGISVTNPDWNLLISQASTASNGVVVYENDPPNCPEEERTCGQ